MNQVSETKKRDTRQRRLTYEAVMKRWDHPTAEQIYQDVRSIDKNISKGTVYRNLNLLAESKEITLVKVPGENRFDRTLTNHYHILCKCCGKVVDAPIDYISFNESKVEEETGFKIDKHSIIFEGLCEDCT